jgi:hypothetical protein
MAVTIEFETLTHESFTFNCASFLPDNEAASIAVFTHGYTASKSDNIAWAQRLSESGIACIIFDLPGHYLGSINKVNSFDEFKNRAHECFKVAYNHLSNKLNKETFEHVILGGHSLGALLALKALDLDIFDEPNVRAIGVGLGLSQNQKTHLFDSSFYQNTLNIRRQLVHSELNSENVFPWIKDEKISFTFSHKKIHLICGDDDVVVGSGGMQALGFMLENLNNEVTMHESKRLPHHEPSKAATHIYSYLKKNGILN